MNHMMFAFGIISLMITPIYDLITIPIEYMVRNTPDKPVNQDDQLQAIVETLFNTFLLIIVIVCYLASKISFKLIISLISLELLNTAINLPYVAERQLSPKIRLPLKALISIAELIVIGIILHVS